MIHLLVSGNRNVAKGLLILAMSYLRHNNEAVTIHFLTMDDHEMKSSFIPPSEAQIEYVRSLLMEHNPDSDIRVYDVGEPFKATPWHAKFRRSSYTPYALLRLFVDMIDLPSPLLYLDTDAFILGDIKPLYETPLADYEFIAASDQLGRFWIDKEYQNSGVMILNLPRIRETKLLEKCRVYLKTHHPILADQTSLNVNVLKKKFLAQKYNEQVHCQEDTVIRHFSKTIRWFPIFHLLNVKPWNVENIHKVDDYSRFKDVLDDYVTRRDAFEQL